MLSCLCCLLFPSENPCVSQSSVLRSAELFDGQQPDRIFKSLQGSTSHESPHESSRGLEFPDGLITAYDLLSCDWWIHVDTA